MIVLGSRKVIDKYTYSEMYTAMYINLADRKDRKKHIENELDKVGFTNFQRFDAIKDNRGYIGCTKSHIACIELAKQRNYPYVIILEDDFEFLIGKDEFGFLLNHLLGIDYDVFILGHNGESKSKTEDNLVFKIKNSQTTSGYIVNSRYYDRLLSNYREGLVMLDKTDDYPSYAIDQYWKRLQDTDKWFCYKKRLGKQRESYSDIMNAHVDYGV